MTDVGQVQVDQSADALYIHLYDAPVESTQEFGDLRNVDYSLSGHVVGVEFLGISAGIDLDGLPENPRLQSALLAHGLGPIIRTVAHTDTPPDAFDLGSLYPTFEHTATGLSGASGANIDRVSSTPRFVKSLADVAEPVA